MAGQGGTMMAGPQLSGSAESGYGIRLSGFHCASRDFAVNADFIAKDIQGGAKISQCEMEGHVAFLIATRDGLSIPAETKLATYRREPHKFFIDLAHFIKSTRACFIDDMVLTSSSGSLCLTILYRPAPVQD